MIDNGSVIKIFISAYVWDVSFRKKVLIHPPFLFLIGKTSKKKCHLIWYNWEKTIKLDWGHFWELCETDVLLYKTIQMKPDIRSVTLVRGGKKNYRHEKSLKKKNVYLLSLETNKFLWGVYRSVSALHCLPWLKTCLHFRSHVKRKKKRVKVTLKLFI